MGSSPSNHDVSAECAERIAIVIQNRIFSNQSPFVEKMENVFWTHFARNEAQVHQLTVTTDAARLHSTQGCASEALSFDAGAQTTAMRARSKSLAPSRSRCRANTSLARAEGLLRSFAFCT